MTEERIPYQQGAILHDAIMGALRANGLTLQGWCQDNDVHESVARNATHGQMRGARGKEMLARIIAAAGPDVVKVGYEGRLRRHAAEMGLLS